MTMHEHDVACLCKMHRCYTESMQKPVTQNEALAPTISQDKLEQTHIMKHTYYTQSNDIIKRKQQHPYSNDWQYLTTER